MKLTKEDIQNFATTDEKKALQETEKKEREVGKLLLDWSGGEDFDWEDFADELTEILQRKNKSGDWFAKVKNFGWRGLDGETTFKGLTTANQFLLKLLPDTDCSFKIYDYGKNGLAINNFHHDSATGREWYYIVPLRNKKDLTESKQLNEKWKARLSEVYSDFKEFKEYDEIYNLAKRLGFDSAEDAWLANPRITGGVNPEEYKVLDHGNTRKMKESTDKQQLAEEKFGSLYVKQQKIIDKFIDRHYHDIKIGGLHFNVEDWPELYHEVAAVREAETLWSDINRYVSDKLSNIVWKNKYPWGDSVDHLITDEDKEGIQEAKKYDELKESVAEQKVANIIKYTDGDLDKWEAMMEHMSERELHVAGFDLQSAIDGINYNFEHYHVRKMQNEYWDELKERRQLYRRYLNRLKKYRKENPRQSLRDKEKEDLYFNHVHHGVNESKKLVEAKNEKGKTRKVEDPYEIYKGDDYGYPDWEWRVLKHYQAADKEEGNPYARVYCAVKSPYTFGSWEYGDTYCKDIPGYKYGDENEKSEEFETFKNPDKGEYTVRRK